jgi:tRNA threonylcarbamoyladenosine biosynthesis protein TsaE
MPDRYTTRSPLEMERLSGRIARLLIERRSRPSSRSRKALAIGLIGDLGSGKTTFVQGFARALGIRSRTVSPTFTIMRRYALPRSSWAYRAGFRSLVHVDCYRVHALRELKVIGFDGWLADPTAVVVIEWADLVRSRLPRTTPRIRFAHGVRERVRSVSLRP